ncbi:MerR family transcriptional regulator [Clavibacter sp. VKM Ac-2542]|uniref:MerR family transcriptional regulator n=1 Tax=Clavibacter TaxID=1573 RepID=UPI00188A35C6|nr:MerR family transcriptional regulator [Clavibacter sp. VKM Ac-2542]MBF4621301.1 MerR family transcriptional regulator [Clavibacter sp. VKM Ac-2542]
MTALPISELAERSGCSVATIKYYLREGLLHPGVKVNARRTAFDETHLARLRLVRGLIHVVGVTIEQAGTILDLVADPDQSVVGAMRKATAALPTGDRSSSAAGEAAPARSTAATEALLDRLGVQHTADSVPVAQLDRALELAEEAGIPLDESQIRTYVDAVRDIADADFSRVPWSDPQGAVEFAVLGTALYEPVLLALRRVAHHEKGLTLERGEA